MRVQIDDERSLNSISSVALATYLEQRDWVRAGEITDRSTVYTKAVHGKQRGIHVPVRDTFPDHADSVAQAIAVLSDAEQRSELEIFHTLAGTGADTVTITALHAAVQPGLSLHDAGHLISNGYTLLASAARSAEKTRPAYRGPMSTDVTHFLRSISLAPISSEAFELTLFSPVPPLYGQPRLLNGNGNAGSSTDPFSRRVVSRLASGLRAMEQAITEFKTRDDSAPFDGAVPSGVSANLCSAVLGLVELSGEVGDGMSVDLHWAATRPQNGNQFVSIPFSTHDTEIIRAAGDRLRSRASFTDEHVVADVVRLEREPEEFDGHAQLLAEIDDQSRRLSVTFDPTDFNAVIAAFRERRRIELDGDLHPVGRGYELRNPSNVRLLEESE